MTGYGFGKKPTASLLPDPGAEIEDRLDFTGIERRPMAVDPALEEAAIRRGDALGFVDRGAGETNRRRRRSTQPQTSVFVKGPQDTLDWFVEYTNQRGHRSYWQTIEEFRSLIEGK
ncbi:hypothetical protein [Novosphingobium sp. P6W]|uniref:hypothetical protein n=1 Tax=Novosphingobium sp. P6W TaxID=1609758 RepID=UPI0005C65263|nr:hypothetical protein [Novosphingobium sp. P6W]AXB80636.1 hypothetical protein TQ38_029090 [Novosphingobium sp. P6W]